MIRIAVLASGGGTNLQALIDAQVNGELQAGKLALVVADREGAFALERAKQAAVPTLLIQSEKGKREQFEQKLEAALCKASIDLIVLAGFLSILSSSFVKKYPHRIINIHPSLIPSFCGAGYYGLHVHQAALERGVKISGATVHFVNEITDGGKILAQKAVEVLPDDTPASLQRRIMEEAEWVLLPRTTEQVCRNLENAMEVEQLLKGNRYPGRGIILGLTEKNEAVCAYFIMGRSNNSRNRVFTLEGETLHAQAYDESLVEDPSLILYSPIRRFENTLIVSNGDQSDTIHAFLKEHKTFSEALATRCYEPDEPNYTPRISGMCVFGQTPSYTLSILRKVDGECQRSFFPYTDCPKGRGHLIHTYEGDGNPLPSFAGSPKEIRLADGLESFTERLWNTLDSDNRIALYVRYTDLETGSYTHKMINKHTR